MHAELFTRNASSTRLFLALMFWFSCLILLLPGSLLGQERQIVTSEIAVSSSEATLRVAFADNGDLLIAFRDGAISVDGEPIGTFERGDALDVSWRALLGQAVAADGAVLSELLQSWEPPEDEGGEAARVVDTTLEARLAAQPEPAEEVDPPAPDAPAGIGQLDGAILEQLLGRPDRLRELSGALEGLSMNGVRVHIGESVTIEEDEVVRGSLLVVDADAELRGRVEGNIVVLGGTLNLHEGSSVTGDVRWNDGRVTGHRDVVNGRIRRAEVAEAEGPTVRQQPRERASPSRNPLRYIGRGIAGLFQNLITFAILAVIGFGVIHFGSEKLDVVARTARRSTAKSAAVGFAAAFLFIPVWVLGIIALAITIIGIPVILAWIPLFPLALGLAVIFGYMAVALNIGEWLASQRFEKLPWLRVSNPFMAIVAGIGVLLAPFVVGNVIQMGGPWLRAMQGMFVAVGVIGGVIVLTVGLGAVLISRGGRRRDFAWVNDFDDGPDHGPDIDPMDWTEPSAPPPPPPPPASPGAGPGTRAHGTGARRSGARGTDARGSGAQGDEPTPRDVGTAEDSPTGGAGGGPGSGTAGGGATGSGTGGGTSDDAAKSDPSDANDRERNT